MSSHVLPGTTTDLLPAGSVNVETVHDLTPASLHEPDLTLVGRTDDETLEARQRARLVIKPWWKRPSPWWMLALVPLGTIADGASVAPRVEILTMLVCDHLKPELTGGCGMEDLGVRPWGANAVSRVSVAEPIFETFLDDLHDAEVVTWVSWNGTTPPPNSDQCKTDAVVQAAVAKLQGVMLTLQGVLAVMTVGWWASLSDRHGRTRILGLAVCGTAFEELVFIFASMYAKRLPGDYWSLLLAPLVFGMIGGTATLTAAIHAYISDCTAPDERSRMFSLLSGMMFIGIAIGPTVGGQLVKHTGNILVVYYLGLGIHAALALAFWLAIPESHSPKQLAAARRKYSAAHAAFDASRKTFGARALAIAITPLRPLAVFAPVTATSSNGSGKTEDRDWNLTFLAGALGAILMTNGGLWYYIQYAITRYSWSPVEVGYWMTSVCITRASFLAIGLPILIKVLKPKKPTIQLPTEVDEPLAGPITSSREENSGLVRDNATLRFDLGLARVSLILFLVGCISIPFAPSGLAFIGISTFNSLGGGFNPAVHAIALELFARQPGRSAAQAGTLFGAIAVLTSIVADVLGPALYGSVYVAAVGVFLPAIWFLSALFVGVGFVLLMLVRIPKNDRIDDEAAQTA